MYCLHCGDCCKRLSPLSAPDPCPYLVEREVDGQFYILCRVYDIRPQECKDHFFRARVCPIGSGLLDLPDTDALRKRIDTGYDLSKEMGYHDELNVDPGQNIAYICTDALALSKEENETVESLLMVQK